MMVFDIFTQNKPKSIDNKIEALEHNEASMLKIVKKCIADKATIISYNGTVKRGYIMKSATVNVMLMTDNLTIVSNTTNSVINAKLSIQAYDLCTRLLKGYENEVYLSEHQHIINKMNESLNNFK